LIVSNSSLAIADQVIEYHMLDDENYVSKRTSYDSNNFKAEVRSGTKAS
jgi:hypothetical protein